MREKAHEKKDLKEKVKDIVHKLHDYLQKRQAEEEEEKKREKDKKIQKNMDDKIKRLENEIEDQKKNQTDVKPYQNTEYKDYIKNEQKQERKAIEDNYDKIKNKTKKIHLPTPNIDLNPLAYDDKNQNKKDKDQNDK